jgi:hypothetical protein
MAGVVELVDRVGEKGGGRFGGVGEWQKGGSQNAQTPAKCQVVDPSGQGW